MAVSLTGDEFGLTGAETPPVIEDGAAEKGLPLRLRIGAAVGTLTTFAAFTAMTLGANRIAREISRHPEVAAQSAGGLALAATAIYVVSGILERGSGSDDWTYGNLAPLSAPSPHVGPAIAETVSTQDLID